MSIPVIWKYIFAAGFYVFISISTTFFNKAVLTNYKFKYANFILLAQHLFTLVILETFRLFGWVSYPSPEWKKCKELLPISLLYSLNVGVALTALGSLNIPMYGVLKRMSTIFVMVGESIVLKKHSSFELKQSVFVIVAGAIIAGAGDLSFDLYAYFMACVSCVAQAAYLIYVAKTGAEKDLNSFGLLFYNSLLAVPFVLLVAIATGELTAARDYPHLFDFRFQILLLMNLILGSLLNYSLFLCTTVNSALTTTIMGHLKNGLSVMLSFLKDGFDLSIVSLLGLLINLAGGVWYSHIKYSEKQNPKPRRVDV
eukprot:TRINITY_DN10865_c0_g1_i1.p1 TRINITY_DN10865_c0_g1~~TRINITY_DN10865_c0_g1_i1.p1  ORF type:complete len:312 (-),score=65.33 TRINITY_DN10865_c0_g1_i1:4-939(-)